MKPETPLPVCGMPCVGAAVRCGVGVGEPEASLGSHHAFCVAVGEGDAVAFGVAVGLAVLSGFGVEVGFGVFVGFGVGEGVGSIAGRASGEYSRSRVLKSARPSASMPFFAWKAESARVVATPKYPFVLSQ